VREDVSDTQNARTVRMMSGRWSRQSPAISAKVMKTKVEQILRGCGTTAFATVACFDTLLPMLMPIIKPMLQRAPYFARAGMLVCQQHELRRKAWNS